MNISIDEFQSYLAKIDGGSAAVDLMKVGNKSAANSSNKLMYQPKMRLLLDMEDCLDRFYGGYYSDWACGGQWNRAYQFVQLLVNAFQMANIEIVAFFDGSLRENKRLGRERAECREKITSVLKHIRMIGTPPPKVWWIPPSGLRTCLRNALRSLNVPIIQTVSDHTMEILAYFHEQRLDGILGLSAEYIIGNVQRYFSSHDLRLSYKGTLESKEFMVAKFLTNFSLTPDHLPFLAALFGGNNHLTDAQLKCIYQKLDVKQTDDLENRIKRIAELVRNAPTNDFDEFVNHLHLQDVASELRETVEYYQRRGKFDAGGKSKNVQRKKSGKTEKAASNNNNGNTSNNGKGNKGTVTAPTVPSHPQSLDDVPPLASETSETDEITYKLLLDVTNLVDENEPHFESEAAAGGSATANVDSVNKNVSSNNNTNNKAKNKFFYTLPKEVLNTALLRHQRGIMDSRIYHLLKKKEIFLPQVLEDEHYREVPSVHLFYRAARQNIYAILFNLFHQRVLYQKNSKLPEQQQQQQKAKKTSKSNGNGNGTATSSEEAVVMPEIIVQEWLFSPQNDYKEAEAVAAVQLPWSVPTIQRLWFGMAFEDKVRRMKAFLTVMRSDAPLILNRTYVPQRMLVMACVLRYIVTNPDRSVLTRAELDAFLATAFSQHLNNIEYTQKMVLPGVNLRGVYLATLFMQGVETASLANDVCGVPLPWLMTNPWLIFDGKLFQMKLKMTAYVQSLRELCDEQIDVVLKIERFKKAILEDVEHFLLPAHIDPMFRFQYLSSAAAGGGGGGLGGGKYSAASSANNGGMSPYGAAGTPQSAAAAAAAAALAAHSAYYGGSSSMGRGLNNQQSFFKQQQQQQQSLSKSSQRNVRYQDQQQPYSRSGHHLKVGGVVVGSWSNGGGGTNNNNSSNNNYMAQRLMSAGTFSTRYNQVGRGRNAATQQALTNRLNRLPMSAMSDWAAAAAAAAAGGAYPHHHHQHHFGTVNRSFAGGFPGTSFSTGGGGGGGSAMGGARGHSGSGGGAGGGGVRQKTTIAMKARRNMKQQQKNANAKKKAKKAAAAAVSKKDSTGAAAGGREGVTEALGQSKGATTKEKKAESSSDDGKGVTKAAANVESLTDLGDSLKELTIKDEQVEESPEGGSGLLDASLVAKVCDEVLKEEVVIAGDGDHDDGLAVAGGGVVGGGGGGAAGTVSSANTPRHILTKKKLISIAAESRSSNPENSTESVPAAAAKDKNNNKNNDNNTKSVVENGEGAPAIGAAAANKAKELGQAGDDGPSTKMTTAQI